MDPLKEKLNKLVDGLSADKKEIVKTRLTNLVSVYPFNEYEYIISTLLAFGKITIEDYHEIRDEYISKNIYLNIFQIGSPRGFGELWAQGHLKELVPELEKPTKKLEENYKGDYDFILPGQDHMVRIEVKASRAVDGDSAEPLYVKALSFDSKQPFWMNFQQIKTAHCDVFVWIAVWRDVIKYWVLSSDEVKNNKYYSKGQHRGNVGEGQLHLKDDNIKDFQIYEVKAAELKDAISRAYERQKGSSK